MYCAVEVQYIVVRELKYSRLRGPVFRYTERFRCGRSSIIRLGALISFASADYRVPFAPLRSPKV